MIVRTRALDTAEAARYVDVLKQSTAAEMPYAAIAALTIGLGARIGEVLGLRNADVLTERGEVREKVRRKIEKKRGGSVYREAAFCDSALRGIVQRYADSEQRKSRYLQADANFFTCRWQGRKLTYRIAWAHNQRFLRAAGIDPHGVAFHGLRKTFLTAVYRQIYADSGEMLKALTCVQRLAGHKSINTTIAYLDISEVNEEATIRAALENITGIKIRETENRDEKGV